MKTLGMALLAGLLVASAEAQTTLDNRSKTSKPTAENMFDRRRREAAEREIAAQKAQFAAARAETNATVAKWEAVGIRTITGRVISVVKPGEQVLVMCSGPQGATAAQSFLTGEKVMIPNDALPSGLESGTVVLLKTPPAMGVLVDQDWVRVLAGPAAETFEYTTALGAKSTVRVYGTVPKAK